MVNAVEIVAFILLLGTPAGLTRYLERHKAAGSTRWLTGRVVGRTVMATIAICALGWMCWQPLGNLLYSETGSQPLVALTLAIIIATVVFSLVQGVLYGLRLFRLNSVLELMQNLGFLVTIAVLLCIVGGDSLSVGIAHFGMTLTAAFFVGYVVYRRLGKSAHAPNEERGSSTSLNMWVLLTFSLGSWTFGSLQRLCRGIDRYMLLHLGDMSPEEALTQVSEYFIALRVGQPIAIVAATLAGVLLPHAALRWERGRRDEVRSMVLLSAKAAMFAMTVGGALLVLTKDWLFTVLIGYVPQSADAVFAMILLSIVVVAFHAIIRTYLLCRERVWRIAGIWLAAFALNAALNIYLIPIHGLHGAVLATTISVGCAAVGVLVAAKCDGLPVDSALWLLTAAPGLIVLPVSLIPVAIGLLVGVAGFSNVLFTADEKHKLFAWFGRYNRPAAYT
jgi:O-antigen/teichoic acid export membrane protein